MAPSYKQNIAKIGEIHGTVNLRFKRPVHEGYMAGSWRAPIQDLARANSSVGARQVLSWRAPSGKLARQLPIWRAPTPLLAHAKSGFGAPTYHLERAKTMPSQCLLISSTACCPDSDSPRSLPPACAWGQAGARPGACPAGPSSP